MMTLLRTALFGAAVLLCMAFTSSLRISPTISQEPGSASFNEGVFDKATINALLEQTDCVGIRLYNVLISEGQTPGTVMAIGYKADGSELNGGFLARPYRRADGVVNGEIKITKLSCGKAADGCALVTKAGFLSYSASFKKEDVLALLNVPDAAGIRTIPSTSPNGDDNMIIQSMKIEGGVPRPIGQGDGYEKISDEPCPTLCGDMENYVNQQ